MILLASLSLPRFSLSPSLPICLSLSSPYVSPSVSLVSLLPQRSKEDILPSRLRTFETAGEGETVSRLQMITEPSMDPAV
jgi:hypothetical protein